MKKFVIWVIALSLLIFSGCDQNSNDDDRDELTVRCFECKQKFGSDQINTDFGMCQSCLLEVGAAYCKTCNKPCYTRDLVEGNCSDCSTTTNTTNTATTTVKCEYCGYSVRSDFMIGDHCAGCYSARQGKCLHCKLQPRETEGSHCAVCKSAWFYCADCGQYTIGSKMFLDTCEVCYLRINAVLVPCPLCGKSFAPWDVKDGYCQSCYAMAEYDRNDETTTQTYSCSACARTFSSASDLYEGKCWSCFNSGKNLCISCKKNPSGGYGPSAMECADCYYGNDVMSGTYEATYENVKIVLTKHDLADYCMTYTDLTTGASLKNIPMSYYNANTPSYVSLVFDLSESTSNYEGSVEIWVNIGARAEYNYWSLIEGMEDTGGYYSPLIKID